MSIDINQKESRIGKFWLEYEKKIILAVGIILIAAISFEAGFLHGSKNKGETVTIQKSETATCPACPQNDTAASSSSAKQPNTSAKTETPTSTDTKNCPFVASKNSNKYHLATCQWALRIKPENKICFASAEEAQQKGYQGAKCCIK